jgi:hypothetical protein
LYGSEAESARLSKIRPVIASVAFALATFTSCVRT